MNQAHCPQTSVPTCAAAPAETLTSLSEHTIDMLLKANERATLLAATLGEESVGPTPDFPNYPTDRPSIHHLVSYIERLTGRLDAQLEVIQRIL